MNKRIRRKGFKECRRSNYKVWRKKKLNGESKECRGIEFFRKNEI